MFHRYLHALRLPKPYCFGTALEENQGVFENRNLGQFKIRPPPPHSALYNNLDVLHLEQLKENC